MPTEINGPFSRRDQRLLNRAMTLAANSPCKHRHGAVLTRGGRIVSQGWNKFRNDPATHEGIACSVHAEVDAMKRVANLTGATLYVARINRAGLPRFSKPCTNCFSALANAGIAKVVYT